MTTKLERIPAAADRMGISISQCYREIKSGRLSPLIKIGERASALPQEAIDKWIADRIAASSNGGKNGGK